MLNLKTLFQKPCKEKPAQALSGSRNAVLPAPVMNLVNRQSSYQEDRRSAYLLEEQLWHEACDYICLLHRECGVLSDSQQRLAEIEAEIKQTGTYWQTPEELAYGARVAWRNNTRCIGRLHWQKLVVRDLRHISTAEEIFQALLDHMYFATNGGKIRSTISIFAPTFPGEAGIRIWNPQLVRYAGYRQPDGGIIGDPAHVDLTDALQALGWRGGPGTPFDVLPIAIQLPGQAPQLFELPQDAVLEVPISHPDFPWFADLGLKWHAVPVISNMRLEIGGLSYSAAPFNGWYMGTEIGARNLGDVERYNLLPLMAQKMGLDTSSERSLWKDRALVELNVAVLSSFSRCGVTMVDHHTASRQFLVHDAKEKSHGRTVPAHWTWLVPPISGSASPLFHITSYKNTRCKPNFFYQSDPWQPSLGRVGTTSQLVCPVSRKIKQACPM